MRKKNNDSDRNIGRPFVIVNQHPENHITFRNLRFCVVKNIIVITYNSKSDGRNIKIFSNSIVKGIGIKELQTMY